MDKVIIKAPAKVNLFLKVLAKQPDGYHKIETLFEKIALFDKIKLQKITGGIRLYSNRKDLPGDSQNLAYRAAALMQDRYKLSLGIKIEIEKSIPIGAGLGGGSSDAAAVLIGINKIYNLALSKEELEPLAWELGADVAFFLSKRNWAVGTQRGDRIEGIDTQMKLWHILIVPAFSILSKEAYEWVDKKRYKDKMPDINGVLSGLLKNDVDLLGKNFYNDLEGISFEREKRLKELKDRLVEDGAKGALISGSGPTLFGITKDKKEAMKLKKLIEKEVILTKKNRWQVLVAPTLNDGQGGV